MRNSFAAGYQCHADRQGHRWRLVSSKIGWHGGKAPIGRPRVRQRGGAELELPSGAAMQKADLPSRWAFNQMLIGVATRKYARGAAAGRRSGWPGQARYDEVLQYRGGSWR
jgi:hypothetical protein